MLSLVKTPKIPEETEISMDSQQFLTRTKPCEQALIALHHSLRDPPHEGALCGKTMEYLLVIIFQNPVPCICCCARTQSAFLPTLLTFLLSPCDIPSLEQRLSRCKCNFMNSYIRRIHMAASRKFSLRSIILMLFRTSKILVQRLKAGKAHQLTSCITRKRFSVEWLRNTSSLLSQGPEVAILALQEWASFLQTSAPAELFTALRRHCPSLLTHGEDFFAQTIGIAETTALNLTDPDWDASRPPNCLISAEHQVQELLEFFSPLEDICDFDHVFQTNYRPRLLKYSRDIYSVLGNIQYSCLDFNRQRKQIVWFMKMIWRDETVKGLEDEIPEELLEILEAEEVPDNWCGDSNLLPGRRHINCLIEEALGNPQCGYAGCHNTVESMGQPFRRCSSCGVVRYCSKECQKASWKALGMQSHKRVCPVLKRLKSLRQRSGNICKIPEEELGPDKFTDEDLGAVTGYFTLRYRSQYNVGTNSEWSGSEDEM